MKNFRPIDSVDSVAGLLSNSSSLSNNQNTNSQKQFQTKFSNIEEIDGEQINIHSERDSGLQAKETRRRPITPIITHYDSNPSNAKMKERDEGSNLVRNSQLSSSSISIKIQTQSPVKLKSPTENAQSDQQYKFNGNYILNYYF